MRPPAAGRRSAAIIAVGTKPRRFFWPLAYVLLWGRGGAIVDSPSVLRCSYGVHPSHFNPRPRTWKRVKRRLDGSRGRVPPPSADAFKMSGRTRPASLRWSLRFHFPDVVLTRNDPEDVSGGNGAAVPSVGGLLPWSWRREELPVGPFSGTLMEKLNGFPFNLAPLWRSESPPVAPSSSPVEDRPTPTAGSPPPAPGGGSSTPALPPRGVRPIWSLLHGSVVSFFSG